MIVRIKQTVNVDAEYEHFKGVCFEVANAFYDKDWVELKNGTDTFMVLWDDVIIEKGRKPTEEEIHAKCFLPDHHTPHYSIPYNPMEDEN